LAKSKYIKSAQKLTCTAYDIVACLYLA